MSDGAAVQDKRYLRSSLEDMLFIDLRSCPSTYYRGVPNIQLNLVLYTFDFVRGSEMS